VCACSLARKSLGSMVKRSLTFIIACDVHKTNRLPIRVPSPFTEYKACISFLDSLNSQRLPPSRSPTRITPGIVAKAPLIALTEILDLRQPDARLQIRGGSIFRFQSHGNSEAIGTGRSKPQVRSPKESAGVYQARKRKIPWESREQPTTPS
jgi:hypothetical protein